MVLQYGKSVWRQIAFALLVGAVIWSAGCRTPLLRPEIPPVHSELVGGGLKIEWTAPVKGTAYLIEGMTNRMVETRSLDQGDTYSFSPATEGQKIEFERIFGVKQSEARFLLYFRPADSK
jgi:hypothetical protein